jgi:hypothetical protein
MRGLRLSLADALRFDRRKGEAAETLRLLQIPKLEQDGHAVLLSPLRLILLIPRSPSEKIQIFLTVPAL